MAIQDSLKLLLKNNTENYSIVAKVESVDKNKRTCTVVPVSDADDKIFGVRLQANQEGTKGIVCFPVVDSQVIVTFQNKQTGYVALFSEIESYEIIIENQTFNYDKDGLELSSPQGSLKSAFEDLLNILKNFKLSTNMGVTIAVLPDIVLQIEQLKTKLNSFLK